MDSLASLALATEAPTDAVLDLPPYSPSQPLLTPSVRRPPPPDPVIPHFIEPARYATGVHTLRMRSNDTKASNVHHTANSASFQSRFPSALAGTLQHLRATNNIAT